MYEMSRVNIKVEPRSTSILFPRQASTMYVRVHALKNFETVEIHPEKEREVREFEIDFKKYFIENDTF